MVPGLVKGSVAFMGFALNTLFWGLLIYLFIPFKLLSPRGSRLRRFSSALMAAFGENWISVNGAGLTALHGMSWRVSGGEGLRKDRSYVVVANHRSWVDIVVLQEIFNRRIPFLRFFLKWELLYVPVLGLAWWALDYPFMRRHSKETLERHPEKRAEDYDAVKRACDRFRGMDVSILNFLEGTRFTPEKRARQGSPYRHLLAPKAGGLAFVLEAMGDRFAGLLDVTIHYSLEKVTLWSLLSGRVREIRVSIRELEIPQALKSGDYLRDACARERAQAWVREIWSAKDRALAEWGTSAAEVRDC